MARASLSAAAQTQVTSPAQRHAIAVDLAFSGGNIRSTTGAMQLSISANTFKPDGYIMGVSGVEERAGTPAKVELTMAATGDMKTRVEAGGYRRKAVAIHFVIIDDDMTVLDTLSSNYRINKIVLSSSPDSHSYVVHCASVMDDMGRAHPVYPSDAIQQLRYSGDTYFAGSSAVRTYEYEWGGRSNIGGGGCVAADTMIQGKRADEYHVGDTIIACDPDTFEEKTATVLYSETKWMPCVKVKTDTGRELVCSVSAPIATDSGMIKAPHLLHYAVPIKNGYIDYERIVEVRKIGKRPVQHIDIGNKCFWANGFLHHNKMKIILTGDEGPMIENRVFP